ncbi:hypothetical protein ACH9DO_05120 [Kocuria sp. M1N1S27]|uniref:hypothetical protein n=1 Tax=Kocuria kalidii TaxID=3376283 RepID=UPI003788641E
MNRKNEITAKETKALQLRSQGRRLDEIAAELDYADASGAHRAIERALRKHQAIGVEEYRALSAAQLDELDAQAAAITAMPGVGAGDLLKAIETRRKIVLSRGEVLGLKGSQGAAHGGDQGNSEAPDGGLATITVMSLDDTPVDVLPPDLDPVGQIPPGVLVIRMDPDWKPRHLPFVFAREGRLLRGNMLFRAEDLRDWLEWRHERGVDLDG